MSRLPQTYIWFSLAIFAMLGTSCGAGVSHETSCKFEYTSAVRENLVVPELKRNFAGAYVYFDYERPVITGNDGRVLVQLSATKTVEGRELAFEDLFFVEIDACGKHIIRSYPTTKYHKE